MMLQAWEGTFGTLPQLTQKCVGLAFWHLPLFFHFLLASDWYWRRTASCSYRGRAILSASISCHFRYRTCGGQIHCFCVCGTPGEDLWPEFLLSELGPQNLHPSHKMNSMLGEEIHHSGGAALFLVQEAQMLDFLGFCLLSNPSLWLSWILGTPGILKMKAPFPT